MFSKPKKHYVIYLNSIYDVDVAQPINCMISEYELENGTTQKKRESIKIKLKKSFYRFKKWIKKSFHSNSN